MECNKIQNQKWPMWLDINYCKIICHVFRRNFATKASFSDTEYIKCFCNDWRSCVFSKAEQIAFFWNRTKSPKKPFGMQKSNAGWTGLSINLIVLVKQLQAKQIYDQLHCMLLSISKFLDKETNVQVTCPNKMCLLLENYSIN
jgi:hypothetical protein